MSSIGTSVLIEPANAAILQLPASFIFFTKGDAVDITQVIALLSGIALFLFGMSLMGDGLKKVSGDKLEPILYKLSGTPLRGLLLGTGVTAVIQSSSATAVMIVGFVSAGMMKVS